MHQLGIALVAASLVIVGCQATPVVQPALVAEPRHADAAPPAIGAPASSAASPSPASESKPVLLDSHQILRRISSRSATSCKGKNATVDAAPHTTRNLARTLPPMLPVLEFVLSEVESRGLVAEFALVPLLESGYRPDPGNRGAHRGLWQFSASTARAAGLRVDGQSDERLAPVLATRAALDYLRELHREFGDWRLAVLAYNAGDHRIRKSLARAERTRDDLPVGVPRHSLRYLRRIEALACLIYHEGARIVPQRLAVTPLRAIALPLHHRSIGVLAPNVIDRSSLVALNPLLALGNDAHRSQAELLLPVDSARRLAEHPLHRGSGMPAAVIQIPRQHTVVAGDNLWSIARRYHLRLDELLGWNRLDARAILSIGRVLRLEP